MLTPADGVDPDWSWEDAGAAVLGLGDSLAQAIFTATYQPDDLPGVLRLLAGLGEPRTLRAAIDAGLRDFAGADLSGAYLDGADLTGANLRGAEVIGADLTGARRYPSDPPIPGWVVVDGRLHREAASS